MADETSETRLRCRCSMFQRTGTCYHTDYKPKFSDDAPPDPPIPDAYRRMYAARRQEARDKRERQEKKERENR